MSAYSRRGPDPLEQGLDRLVSKGRQLVDGVSGARPGSRPPARGTGRRSGSLPRLDDLGRWVEDKLDWILDDEDDWREPWQEQPPSRRRPLEAISRRSLPRQGSASAAERPPLSRGEVDAPPVRSGASGRPLPRSSRRRSF